MFESSLKKVLCSGSQILWKLTVRHRAIGKTKKSKIIEIIDSCNREWIDFRRFLSHDWSEGSSNESRVILVEQKSLRGNDNRPVHGMRDGRIVGETFQRKRRGEFRDNKWIHCGRCSRITDVAIRTDQENRFVRFGAERKIDVDAETRAEKSQSVVGGCEFTRVSTSRCVLCITIKFCKTTTKMHTDRSTIITSYSTFRFRTIWEYESHAWLLLNLLLAGSFVPKALLQRNDHRKFRTGRHVEFRIR